MRAPSPPWKSTQRSPDCQLKERSVQLTLFSVSISFLADASSFSAFELLSAPACMSVNDTRRTTHALQSLDLLLGGRKLFLSLGSRVRVGLMSVRPEEANSRSGASQVRRPSLQPQIWRQQAPSRSRRAACPPLRHRRRRTGVSFLRSHEQPKGSEGEGTGLGPGRGAEGRGKEGGLTLLSF